MYRKLIIQKILNISKCYIYFNKVLTYISCWSCGLLYEYSLEHDGSIVTNQFPAAGYGTKTRANSELLSDPDTLRLKSLPPGHKSASSLSRALLPARNGLSLFKFWLIPILFTGCPLFVFDWSRGSLSGSNLGMIFFPLLKQALTVYSSLLTPDSWKMMYWIELR